MGVSQKWLRIVRRKFLKSSNKDITLPPRTTQADHVPGTVRVPGTVLVSVQHRSSPPPPQPIILFNNKDFAANKIQAFFRGHLARRAHKALKSLVKLQALVRGVSVRRQSRIAMQCMHALVRLQVKVRARQLLARFDHATQ